MRYSTAQTNKSSPITFVVSEEKTTVSADVCRWVLWFLWELRKAELLKDVFDKQITEEGQTQGEQVQTREDTTKPKRKGDEGR